MRQVAPKDFFISYNQADRLWAEWIAWQIEEDGYSTILQAWDFRPGSNFIFEMNRAATEAKRTIAVLSPEYLSAQYTQLEWASALAQDPTGERGALLPVRVRKCDVVGLFAQIIYVDLVDIDERDAKSRLLAEVHRARTKPLITPEYPSIHQSVTAPPRFPSSLPPIWNAPNRNLNFTGRDEILSNLHDQLKQDRYSAVTQAISGLGGIGKTQIAIEYAYRFSRDYDLVWWMRAEEPAMLSADYARLAWKLRLPEKDAADQIVAIEAVRSWLGHSKGWLLIFDNAVDQSDLRSYLPQGGAGHVLITSRNQNWRGTAKPLSVSVLNRQEAVAFIAKRTGLKQESFASALAEALGDLPLALEQAGAYIEAIGISLSEYLELFLQHKSELLRRGKPSTDYPATVATTWEMSFQKIQSASVGGADLMNLCAFLAPDEIPRKLLYEHPIHLPGSLGQAVSDRFVLDDAVEALRRYSLASVSQESISIHRLVQAVTQDKLTQEAKKSTAENALRLVNEAFPTESDDVRTWSICKSLLSHALVVTRHAEDLGLRSTMTGRLLNQVGLYLRGRAEFKEAMDVLTNALAVDELIHQPEHPTIAIRLNNLGELFETLGDLNGAKERYEKALANNQLYYGRNHPTVASNLNNLGNVMKKLADSKVIFDQNQIQRVNQILEEVGDAERQAESVDLGPMAPTVLASTVFPLENRSDQSYLAVKDLYDARKCFKRALEINEAVFGPDHPTVANNLNNLGNVLLGLCDPTRARSYFERALTISESFYGLDHPTVASISNSLGSVLKRLGDLEAAMAQYVRALKIDQMFYGLSHPMVALRINNIGHVWQELGDKDKARELYNESLQIFRKSLGDNHPYTITVQNNLRSLLK